MMMFKAISFSLIFSLFIIFGDPVIAVNFGVVGKTSEIIEKDAIEEIQQKLVLMEKTGALESHSQVIKERISNSIKNPISLNIPTAEKARLFTYDPSIVVQEDIRDGKGVIFQKAGRRVNPLDSVNLSYKLIFFDASDEKQLFYALKAYQEEEIKPKLILTGGSPIEIEKEHGLDVYFDQRGILVKQLGIKAVPAIVEQREKVLLVQEVKLLEGKEMRNLAKLDQHGNEGSYSTCEHTEEHRDHPLEYFVFNIRNFGSDLSHLFFKFRFSSKFIRNLGSDLSYLFFKFRFSSKFFQFFLEISDLFFSSKFRKIIISGFQQGFNNYFCLFFIKARSFKFLNIFMSIKTDKVHRFFLKDLLHKIKYITILSFIVNNIINIGEVQGAPCVGKFVNPITDICWSCIFPIKIGNIPIYSGGREDTENPGTIPCLCPKQVAGVMVPVPGIPISLWEPARLADITRTPYCMVSLGGLELMKSSKKHGAVARKATNESLKHSFYHVHWYIYPLIYWLELVTDFICLEQASIDVAYMSEFDPLWSNDELNAILNPEAILFSNPIAQLACAADCVSANSHFSQESLFWCAGCNGSLYPFGGFIEHHVGGVQASSLIVERTLARLHRVGLAWDTVSDVCKKKLSPKIKKTQYKLQMTYPMPNSKGAMSCNPFGRTTAIWGAGREIPGNGEDFGYLVWRKKYCCLL